MLYNSIRIILLLWLAELGTVITRMQTNHPRLEAKVTTSLWPMSAKNDVGIVANTSLSFGPLLALIMLEMDENDGFTALKIVLVVTMLTGFIGYSDFYSFSENKIFGAFLLIALLGLLLFNLARFFISISRPTVRAGAIFGAVLFSLFLLYDFNYIKQREDLVSNNWETALEMAFILYLDIINLLLEILDAMGNS